MGRTTMPPMRGLLADLSKKVKELEGHKDELSKKVETLQKRIKKNKRLFKAWSESVKTVVSSHNTIIEAIVELQKDKKIREPKSLEMPELELPPQSSPDASPRMEAKAEAEANKERGKLALEYLEELRTGPAIATMTGECTCTTTPCCTCPLHGAWKDKDEEEEDEGEEDEEDEEDEEYEEDKE